MTEKSVSVKGGLISPEVERELLHLVDVFPKRIDGVIRKGETGLTNNEAAIILRNISTNVVEIAEDVVRSIKRLVDLSACENPMLFLPAYMAARQ
jgi:hypothetical protein